MGGRGENGAHEHDSTWIVGLIRNRFIVLVPQTLQTLPEGKVAKCSMEYNIAQSRIFGACLPHLYPSLSLSNRGGEIKELNVLSVGCFCERYSFICSDHPGIFLSF
ncbi:hypothetical protein K2173_020760 [Erythroxylum novogranatense]|uniref:Uncharacterized protein n=1 Tax=Erythroxylum novogranatense TaxID=1862640 RepID=A0AAV8TPC2_9ROSI|nr:hypothetical protein K2173_020760 [Erythroxylum novogranatense]